MKSRTFIYAGLVLSLFFFGLAGHSSAVAGQGRSLQSGTQHQHGAKSGETEAGMMATCQEMMAMHKQAKDDMAVMDARLDVLVEKMTLTTKRKKVDAVVDVLAELVAQRKAMHTRMMSMQPRMMGHMAEHMGAGMNGDMMSMSECPMMRMTDKGSESGASGMDDHSSHHSDG